MIFYGSLKLCYNKDMRRDCFYITKYFTKSKIFLACLLGFINGIVCGTFLNVPFLFVFVLGLLSLFVVFVCKNKLIRILFLIIICCLLGIIRYNFSKIEINQNQIAFYNEQNTEFIGLICKEPDVRGAEIKYTVCSRQVDDKKVNGKVLVTAGLFPNFEYGDLVKIKCTLKTPEQFEDFAYDKYLARYDIYSTCSFAKIYLQEKNRANFLFSKILGFKYKLKDNIDLLIKKPQSGIFSAMALGLKREIPTQILQQFSYAGVSHVIAISGMHITIISGILMSICVAVGLSRKKAFYFCTVCLLLYVIIVGLPASAVRAGIMGFLVLLSMQIGRASKITNSLFFVAAIMLLINPRLLRDDIGFQLSFMAVLSLVYFGDFWEKVLLKIKIPRVLGIFEGIQMTMAAQVLTLPIIIYYFGVVSIIAPIANVLIVPILPYIMMSGFAAMLVGIINVSLAKVIVLPAFLGLSFLLNTVEVLTNLPHTYFVVEKVGLQFVFVYYFILIVLWLKKKTVKHSTTNKQHSMNIQ